MKLLARASTILTLTIFASPVLAQSISHFDQPVRRHITLEQASQPSTLCPGTRGFFERFPAGDLSSDEFRVPGGDLLVITDFTWSVNQLPTGFADTRTLETNLSSLFPGQLLRTVYRSKPINITALLEDHSRIGGGDHILSGVRVGTGRYICATSSSRGSNSFASHTVARAEIHGYLIKKP